MSFIKGAGFVHDASGATASSVQAALAADPEGAREELDLVHGQVSREAIVHGPIIPRTAHRLANLALTSPAKLTFLSIGDSFALDFSYIGERYFGRELSSGGGVDATRWLATANTTANIPAARDATLSPTGGYWEVDNAETIIMEASASVGPWMQKIMVFYTAQNGGGSFSVQEDTGSGWTAIHASLTGISTNNAGAKTPMVASHTYATSLRRRIRVIGTAGTSIVWGICGTDRYTTAGVAKGGFECWQFGRSGSDMGEISATSQAMIDMLYQTLSPDIVIYKSNDSTTHLANLPTYIGKVQAALPGIAGNLERDEPDFFFLAQHPTNNVGYTTRDQTAEDLLLMGYAETYSGTYVNSRNIYRNYDFLRDLITGEDGLHITGPGDGVCCAYICAAVNQVVQGLLENKLMRLVTNTFNTGSYSHYCNPDNNAVLYRNLTGAGIGNAFYGIGVGSTSDAWFQYTNDGKYRQVIKNSRFYFAGEGFGTTCGTGMSLPATAGFTFLGSGVNEPSLRVLHAAGVTSADLLQLCTGSSTSSAGTTKFAVNFDGTIRPTSKTPASASDTGVVGTICADANYIYVCTATNTWKRVAIATW